MKWIVYKMDDWGCTNCRCPECQKEFFIPRILIEQPEECPNCGAKNEEETK